MFVFALNAAFKFLMFHDETVLFTISNFSFIMPQIFLWYFIQKGFHFQLASQPNFCSNAPASELVNKKLET